MEPKVFAPGIVSIPDLVEWSGAFSPDGSEYCFYRFSDTSQSRLFFSKVEDGKWTVPEEPAFSAAISGGWIFVSLKVYDRWSERKE